MPSPFIKGIIKRIVIYTLGNYKELPNIYYLG